MWYVRSAKPQISLGSLIRAFASLNTQWLILATDRTTFGILRLKGGCTGSPESIHVKMPHCWKSHAAAHFIKKTLAGRVEEDATKFAWVKVFRIIPEFRILRLTFHRKSASKSWIRQILMASLIWFKLTYIKTIDHLNFEIVDIYSHCASFKIWFSKVQDFGNFELSPVNLSPAAVMIDVI